MGQLGSARSTVFINDVAFEVAGGSFNVRECFGDDAVLLHSSGQPVLTNEWGVTLQQLQHGAFYYLVRTFELRFDLFICKKKPTENTSGACHEVIDHVQWMTMLVHAS